MPGHGQIGPPLQAGGPFPERSWSIASVPRSGSMSRVAYLLSRRIPLYVWLPIVLACVGLGFGASMMRPLRHGPSAPQVPPFKLSTTPSAKDSSASASTRTVESQNQISRALGPPRDAPVVLPVYEIDLPTPLPAGKAAEHSERILPQLETARPAPKLRTANRATSLARSDQPRSKGRRPQRTAPQPAKAAPATFAGLKSIPIIGLLFQ